MGGGLREEGRIEKEREKSSTLFESVFIENEKQIHMINIFLI